MRCQSSKICNLKSNGEIQWIGFQVVTQESFIIKQTVNSKTQSAWNICDTCISWFYFIFPFADFPSLTASATVIYLHIWESVHILSMFCLIYNILELMDHEEIVFKTWYESFTVVLCFNIWQTWDKTMSECIHIIKIKIYHNLRHMLITKIQACLFS